MNLTSECHLFSQKAGIINWSLGQYLLGHDRQWVRPGMLVIQFPQAFDHPCVPLNYHRVLSWHSSPCIPHYSLHCSSHFCWRMHSEISYAGPDQECCEDAAERCIGRRWAALEPARLPSRTPLIMLAGCRCAHSELPVCPGAHAPGWDHDEQGRALRDVLVEPGSRTMAGIITAPPPTPIMPDRNP